MTQQTERRIRNAIKRIEINKPRQVKANTKLSISAVAKEAGISHASIHNRYPEWADIIRKKSKKTADDRIHQAKDETKKAQEIKSKLWEDNQRMSKALDQQASIILRLTKENEVLKKQNQEYLTRINKTK